MIHPDSVRGMIREHNIIPKEVTPLLRQSNNWVCLRMEMIERLLIEVQDETAPGSISLSRGNVNLQLSFVTSADNVVISQF